MKIFLLTVTMILMGHFSPAQELRDSQTTDKVISSCYDRYPFFLEAISLVSDKDYQNSKKSKARIQKIKQQVDRSHSNEIKACLATIVQSSKESKDPSTYHYVKTRMAEIETAVQIQPYNVVERSGK